MSVECIRELNLSWPDAFAVVGVAAAAAFAFWAFMKHFL